MPEFWVPETAQEWIVACFMFIPGFLSVFMGILYGYAPALDAVIGIRVLETKETPGLGDKIEKKEAKLVEKINSKIEKNRERFTLSAHDAMKSKWASAAQKLVDENSED